MKIKNKIKVAMLISGGVDSSVALKLLKEQGYDITAFYLKIWLEDELSFLGNCPWAEDLSYIKKICEKEQIPLEIIPFQKEYWQEVVNYSLSEIKIGRTPNPDILCNKKIKFGAFYKKFAKNFDKIATGHYAQIEESNGQFYLKQAPDPIKDQTYFLSHLNQDQFKKALFPIGHLKKSEVRELAKKFDLPNKERKDSQGICFLGKIKFSDFIKHHLGEKQGDIIETETGKKMGSHNGFWYYTIGQRQGLGLSGGPWYVVDKDIPKNIVYISKNYYSEDKNRNKFEISNFNWIKKPSKRLLEIKLRHGAKTNKCQLDLKDDKGIVILESRDQGIAPGQFAVFYEDGFCLGGGIITKSL